MQDAGSSRNASPRVPTASAPESSTTLICFSHLRWGFVYQRPQHLMTRAARRYRVIFFEEPVYSDEAEPRLDLAVQPSGVTVAVPVLPYGMEGPDVEDAQRLLVDTVLAADATQRLISWYYTPMALGFSAHLRPDVCVYDCMDELSGFLFAPTELKERERALLARADLVFTGGQSLYEAKRGRHPRVHAFPSSIDARHFGRARGAAVEPADQVSLPRPRLGFFGVIDERMDLELLSAMTALRPDWQFVMIGPVVKIDPATLPHAENIHWLNGRSYDELPDYLAGWDVGLMPFALNAATRYISPTKTPEFLAAGVPVVSTPITDVVRTYGDTGLVEIAADAEAMVGKAEMLMARPRHPWIDRVDAVLARSSWDSTWDAMEELIRSVDAPASEPGRAWTSTAEAANAAHV